MTKVILNLVVMDFMHQYEG